MSRFDRLVRRLGTATTTLLDWGYWGSGTLERAPGRLGLVLELQEGEKAGVDPRVIVAHRILRADTWAGLGTQGDHRNPQQKLVPHELIEDQVVALVEDDVGLFGRELRVVEVVGVLGLFVFLLFRAPRGRGAALRDGQGAQLFVNGHDGGLEAARAGDHQRGREAAADHDVGPALRQAQVEIAVALGRPDVGALESAPQPGSAEREVEALASGVELVHGK